MVILVFDAGGEVAKAKIDPETKKIWIASRITNNQLYSLDKLKVFFDSKKYEEMQEHIKILTEEKLIEYVVKEFMKMGYHLRTRLPE